MSLAACTFETGTAVGLTGFVLGGIVLFFFVGVTIGRGR